MASSKDSDGWVLPGTNTAVAIGGYVELGMIYRTDQNLGDAPVSSVVDIAKTKITDYCAPTFINRGPGLEPDVQPI